MSSMRIHGRVVMLAGLLSMVAAACGGSDSSSSPSTIGLAPTTPTTISAATTTAPTSTDVPTPSSTLPPPTKSILELAQGEPTLTTLLHLVDVAGMTTLLQGDGPFTLIAPSNDAFAKMDPDTLDRITKSPESLTALLNYHLINARVTTQDVTAGFVTSAEGSTIALQATTKLPTINGLSVTKAGRATNGTILVIESVLIPVDFKMP
ncbi:MAG: fasciclin domain-containing protein [Ilumatobacteraceae bacterium]